MAATREVAATWNRLLEAIDSGARLAEDVAHSLGDSLTYWRTTTTAISSANFVAHRRYQTVLASLDDDCSCEIARARALIIAKPYSDLADREELLPPADADIKRHLIMTRGQVVLVPIDHAWRVLPTPTANLLVVRVTVEAATFHNK